MSLANELRIGNWVEILGNSKRLDFFTTIQPSSFSVNIDKTYGPIPLDEDWLLKFGFEKFEFDNGQPNQYRYSDRLLVIRNGKIVDYGSSTTLNYVHQLQNLFFAITQTELQLTK